jgi:8-oxo-dGTP pyrophosphatase MutT (NUDIX family)
MLNVRKSYGIICCRTTDKGVSILMIKKATTYHFCEFVAGRYRRANYNHLTRLFNNMTYHEKVDILSMNFQNMWYRIYHERPDTDMISNVWVASYFKKKNKFEKSFMSDRGEYLKRLISNSRNVETPWEFPKGRPHERESEIDTAIREFSEETGVDSSKYKILWDTQPYVETYTDFGVTYKNTYYFAEAIGEWEPVYKFCDKQVSEVAAIRWVPRNELSLMQLEPITFRRLLNSFEKITRKYKDSHKKTANIIKYADAKYESAPQLAN